MPNPPDSGQDMDDESMRAAQHQALAMLAAMGGSSRGTGRSGFAAKASQANPVAGSSKGSKLDELASTRLNDAAAAAEVRLDGEAKIRVGGTTEISSRGASSRLAAQLERSLRELEMASMMGGMATSFSWHIESGLNVYIVTVNKSVV